MCVYMYSFLLKPKTSYEMRSSDLSSDVCSSDLVMILPVKDAVGQVRGITVDSQHDRAGARLGRGDEIDYSARIMMARRLEEGADPFQRLLIGLHPLCAEIRRIIDFAILNEQLGHPVGHVHVEIIDRKSVV